MDTQRAINLVTGYEDGTSEEYVRAYQKLLNSRQIWRMSDKYQRRAELMIKEGVLKIRI